MRTQTDPAAWIAKLAFAVIAFLLTAAVTTSGTAAFYFGQLTTETRALHETLTAFMEAEQIERVEHQADHAEFRNRIRALERVTPARGK